MYYSHYKLKFLFVFFATGLLFSCSDDDPVSSVNGTDDPVEPVIEFRQATYDLNSVSNSGVLPNGVEATATFQELHNNQTLITLSLEGESTETGLIHTAHIHENDVETGGGIEYFLGPIDGLDGAPGTSEYVVDASFDELTEFDGYINIHESNDALGVIISQGNIGGNANVEITESTLTPIENPQTKQYTLNASPNAGLLADGAGAVATFHELTSNQTLVKLELTGGTTETELSHPAHIHFNNVVEGGGIAYFLGPIDGLPGSEGVSYAVIDESFDFLTGFDGYINIHESNASLDVIVSQGNIGANENLTTLRQASFPLNAVSNNGTFPEGVSGTATYWELNDEQSVVTLQLDEGPTGADVSHTAHIHFNSAADGGDIAYFLTPIDGSDPNATSARIINEPFDKLMEFDSHINIHESIENISTLVSQGDTGSNADVDTELGLDPVDNMRSMNYDLKAVENNGLLPDGFTATATFTEIMPELTVVTLDLDSNGATGAGVSHTAHIHDNSVEDGGGIAWYLGAIDGMDPDSRSSYLIAESFDALTDFNGHINVHESLANLPVLITQGNIGSNVGSGGNGNNDYDDDNDDDNNDNGYGY